jgi:hypothetical protein
VPLTNAATSWICFELSVPLKAGIEPLGLDDPFVTTLTTFACEGFVVSRFGPIVPVEPAALNVWHVPHPAFV